MRSELTEYVPSDWHDGDAGLRRMERPSLWLRAGTMKLARGDEGVARQRPRTAMAESAVP